MKITPAEVARVAALARLTLDDAELQRYAGQLDRVLAYVAQLDELDTRQVAPTTHAVPVQCPLREDAVEPGLSRERLLAAAPEHDDGHFVVPRVIDS